MIGSQALVFWLVLAVFPLLAIVGIWGKKKKTGKAAGPLEVVGSGFALILFCVASYTFGRTLLWIHELRVLAPDSVRTMRVRDVSVSPGENRRKIIEAMNKAVLFFPQHGGWRDEIPVRIELNSGSRFEFRIAEYPAQGGVVFVSPRYAFSSSLSRALRESGINISEMEDASKSSSP